LKNLFFSRSNFFIRSGKFNQNYRNAVTRKYKNPLECIIRAVFFL